MERDEVLDVRLREGRGFTGFSRSPALVLAPEVLENIWSFDRGLRRCRDRLKGRPARPLWRPAWLWTAPACRILRRIAMEKVRSLLVIYGLELALLELQQRLDR